MQRRKLGYELSIMSCLSYHYYHCLRKGGNMVKNCQSCPVYHYYHSHMQRRKHGHELSIMFCPSLLSFPGLSFMCRTGFAHGVHLVLITCLVVPVLINSVLDIMAWPSCPEHYDLSIMSLTIISWPSCPEHDVPLLCAFLSPRTIQVTFHITS